MVNLKTYFLDIFKSEKIFQNRLHKVMVYVDKSDKLS